MKNKKDKPNKKFQRKPLAKISITDNAIVATGKINEKKSKNIEEKKIRKQKTSIDSAYKHTSKNEDASIIWKKIEEKKVDLNYALIGFSYIEDKEIPIFSYGEITKLLIQYGFQPLQIAKFIIELNSAHLSDPSAPIVMTTVNEASIYLNVKPIV